MALWQYTFHILPRENVQALSPDFHFEKNIDGFDDKPYWKLNQISKEVFEPLSKILPKTKSWSNKIHLYGNQESNCVEVYFEDENVVSASFRVNFTSEYEVILSELTEFCLYQGLIIIDEDLKVVPLNMEIIKHTIQTSPQIKKYNQLAKK